MRTINLHDSNIWISELGSVSDYCTRNTKPKFAVIGTTTNGRKYSMLCENITAANQFKAGIKKAGNKTKVEIVKLDTDWYNYRVSKKK